MKRQAYVERRSQQSTYTTRETLGVVRVDDGADGAGNAGRRASPANTATLAPLRGLGEGTRDDRGEEREGSRELHVTDAGGPGWLVGSE